MPHAQQPTPNWCGDLHGDCCRSAWRPAMVSVENVVGLRGDHHNISRKNDARWTFVRAKATIIRRITHFNHANGERRFPFSEELCVYSNKVCAYPNKVCAYSNKVCVYPDEVCAYSNKVCPYLEEGRCYSEVVRRCSARRRACWRSAFARAVFPCC